MSARAKNLIEVRDLRTAFGAHVVHDGLDLDVRTGEVLGVVGGSGSGKSVLMNAILGLIEPAEGEIVFNGRKLADMPEKERVRLKAGWGVLFQGGALFSALTVKENVMAPMREHVSMSSKLMGELADMKISLAGLDPEVGPKFPSELSGGMKKRVALARALSLDPAVLFLDEPTAGLDPISAAALDGLIRELCETLDLTVFLITHDLDTLHTLCDRVAVVAEKRIIAVDKIAKLLTNPHPWIQDYFGGPRGRAALASQQG